MENKDNSLQKDDKKDSPNHNDDLLDNERDVIDDNESLLTSQVTNKERTCQNLDDENTRDNSSQNLTKENERSIELATDKNVNACSENDENLNESQSAPLILNERDESKFRNVNSDGTSGSIVCPRLLHIKADLLERRLPEAINNFSHSIVCPPVSVNQNPAPSGLACAAMRPQFLLIFTCAACAAFKRQSIIV